MIMRAKEVVKRRLKNNMDFKIKSACTGRKQNVLSATALVFN